MGSSNQFTTPWQDEQMLKVELTGSEAYTRLEQWDRDWSEGSAGIRMSSRRYHNTYIQHLAFTPSRVYPNSHFHLLLTLSV